MLHIYHVSLCLHGALWHDNVEIHRIVLWVTRPKIRNKPDCLSVCLQFANGFYRNMMAFFKENIYKPCNTLMQYIKSPSYYGIDYNRMIFNTLHNRWWPFHHELPMYLLFPNASSLLMLWKTDKDQQYHVDTLAIHTVIKIVLAGKYLFCRICQKSISRLYVNSAYWRSPREGECHNTALVIFRPE